MFLRFDTGRSTVVDWPANLHRQFDFAFAPGEYSRKFVLEQCNWASNSRHSGDAGKSLVLKWLQAILKRCEHDLSKWCVGILTDCRMPDTKQKPAERGRCAAFPSDRGEKYVSFPDVRRRRLDRQPPSWTWPTLRGYVLAQDLAEFLRHRWRRLWSRASTPKVAPAALHRC